MPATALTEIHAPAARRSVIFTPEFLRNGAIQVLLGLDALVMRYPLFVALRRATMITRRLIVIAIQCCGGDVSPHCEASFRGECAIAPPHQLV